MRSRHWRVGAVVAVQLAILAAIPLRQVRARVSGTTVTLETVPVNPYDVLSGYYVTLAYEAERVPYLGGDADGGPAWLVVARGSPAWKGVACRRGLPSHGPDEVALAAEVVGGRCRIASASRFYVPEGRRAEVEAALRSVRSRALVDLRVNDAGDVALVRLRAGDVVVGR